MIVAGSTSPAVANTTLEPAGSNSPVEHEPFRAGGSA